MILKGKSVKKFEGDLANRNSPENVKLFEKAREVHEGMKRVGEIQDWHKGFIAWLQSEKQKYEDSLAYYATGSKDREFYEGAVVALKKVLEALE